MSVLVPPTEFVTEAKVTEYALGKKCLTLKLNVIGRVGWPDRIYMYHGKIIFVEFKRAGQKPRRIQDHVIGTIRSHGFRVYVVDNYEQGCTAIDQLTEGGPQL